MSLVDGLGVPDYQGGLPSQSVSVSVAQLFTLHTASDTTTHLLEPTGYSCLHMMGQVAGAGPADTVTFTVSNEIILDHLNVPMVRKYVVPATGFLLRIPCWGTFLKVTARSSVDGASCTMFSILDSQPFYTVQDFTNGPRALYVAAVLPVGVNVTPLQLFCGRALVTAVVVAGTNIVFSIRAKDPGGGADIYVAQWTQLTIPNNHLVAEVVLPPQAWYVEWDNNDAGAQTVYVTVTPQVDRLF